MITFWVTGFTGSRCEVCNEYLLRDWCDMNVCSLVPGMVFCPSVCTYGYSVKSPPSGRKSRIYNVCVLIV